MSMLIGRLDESVKCLFMGWTTGLRLPAKPELYLPTTTFGAHPAAYEVGAGSILTDIKGAEA